MLSLPAFPMDKPYTAPSAPTVPTVPSELQVIIDPPSDLFHKDFKAWVTGLRHFIFTEILPMVIPPDNQYRNDYGKILISDEAMKIWVVGFTDPSVDRNPDSNYELLELLGDRQLESCFTNFVVNRYPDITEKTLTEAKSIYASKIEQAKKARELGLHKWVRTNTDLTIHTSEDLYESLFGVLFKIGDQLIGKGNGYALCSNLTAYLFYDLSIDYEAIMTRPVTQIKEIFEKLGWSERDKFKVEELGIATFRNLPDGSTKWTLELRLTNKAMDFLRREGKVDAKGPVLTLTEANNKPTLETEGYKDAVQALKSRFGIDYKWATDYAEKKIDADTKTIAGERIKQDNVTQVYFSKYKKTGDRQFIQLLGTDRASNRIIILLSVNSERNAPLSTLKDFTLRYYASNGKVNPIISVNYDPSF